MTRALVRLVDESDLQLTDRFERLWGIADQQLERAENTVAHLTARLGGAHPASRLEHLVQQFASLSGALDGAWKNNLQARTHRLERVASLLEELSPTAQLGRGYALVRRASDRHPITNATAVQVGDDVDIQLATGALAARVTGRSS